MGHQASRAGDFDQVGAMKGFPLVRLMTGAAALVLVAASGASAQEEGVLAKNILGSIGIIPKERPRIDYRERAPLVLPSKTDLRAPAASSEVESRVANWPKDPDVAAARKEAAEDAKPSGQREVDRLNDGYRLSIDEIRAGRRTGGSRSETAFSDNRADKSRLSPDELKLPREEEAKLDRSKLERRYLSDPPQSLLNAAAGAPLKASADPEPEHNPESPAAFQRQQKQR